MYDLFIKSLQKVKVIWLLFILFILSGCQPADVQGNIFGFSAQDFKGIITPSYETYVEPVKEQKIVANTYYVEENKVVGVISSKEDVGLIEDEDFGTVVLIASTDYQTERNKIFTYSSPAIYSNLIMDTEMIQEITEGGVISDRGNIAPGSYWNDPFLYRVTNTFRGAKVVLISVNESHAEILAHILKLSMPEDGLLIALTDVSLKKEGDLRDFQNGYVESALNSLNSKNLPVENAAVATLEKYLQFKGAKKAEVIQSENNFQAAYYKGEAEVQDEAYLVFFGDIMLGRFVRNLMDQNGHDYPFVKMDQSYLEMNDLLIANLEGPISDRAVRTITSMVFGFFPDTKEILGQFHFDVLDLANNHIYDKQTKGFQETKKYLDEVGITYYGDGKDVYEAAVAKVEVGSHKLAFMGMEDVIYASWNEEEAIRLIREYAAQGYKVIVTPHWGIEYKNVPNGRQRELAHRFIDAGAYAIVAHHPHVPQAYESYKGKPIFYSLGNAIFDQYWSAETQVGLSVAMKIEPEQLTMYLVPIKLPRSQFQLMSADEKSAFLEEFVTYGAHEEEEKAQILSGKIVIPLSEYSF
ncbi:CapA family protein [Pseudomonadota bacterium]